MPLFSLYDKNGMSQRVDAPSPGSQKDETKLKMTAIDK